MPHPFPAYNLYSTTSSSAIIQDFAMQQTPSANMVNLTYLIYGLHLFSAINGVLTSAFVVTAFLSGWPSILAVILNYLQRGATRDTYLESHFRWQIRTFWFAFLWLLIGAVLVVTVIGIPVAWIMVVVVGLWVLYRMLRGLARLMDQEAMPVD
jgi:uncharacterized membrane protein